MIIMSTGRNAVTIRGTKSGLQIALSDADPFDDLCAQLEERLNTTESFFQGARVALDVGDRQLSREDWSRLEGYLKQKGLILTAALSGQEGSRVSARALGIPLVTEARRDGGAPAERRRPPPEMEQRVDGLMIRQTLRSGQVVRHTGSVIVLGDVNSGAEIIAAGDIVVWGSLRGMVHAGSAGDEKTCVCALHLSPTQLRLAGHIARSPGSRPRLLDVPEIATLKDGAIIVEEWSRIRRPVNLSFRTLLFLALVYALEAIALATAVRLFPPAWSPLYVVAIVILAIVLGWLVAILTVNRQEGYKVE